MYCPYQKIVQILLIFPWRKQYFREEKKTKKKLKKIVLIRDIYIIIIKKVLPWPCWIFFYFSSPLFTWGSTPWCIPLTPMQKKSPCPIFIINGCILIHTNNSLEILYMVLLVQSAENPSMARSCVVQLTWKKEMKYHRDFSNIIFNVNIFRTVNVIQ